MENFAPAIENLLKEQLSLYEELHDVVAREKAFVVEINTEALWKTAEAKKSLARAIDGKNKAIRALFSARVSRYKNEDIDKMEMAELLNALPIDQKQKVGIRKILYKIQVQKDALVNRSNENRRYIVEYLSVIDGIFSTAVNAKNQDQYGKSGGTYSAGERVRLIQAEV